MADAATRRYFDRLPIEPRRRRWQEWLRRHGVDPNKVIVPGWIERREQEYRLAYESYELDEHGNPAWDNDDIVRVARFVQLEGPPLPFPD